MGKIIRALLLLVGALGLTWLALYLAVEFEIYAAARELIVLWWQGLIALLQPFVRVYAVRRLLKPVWRTTTRAFIFLIGYELTIKMRELNKMINATVKSWFAWWKALPKLLRWGLVCGIIFATGFLGFGLYILPLWLPFIAPLYKRVNMLWMDVVFDRWIAPVRRWFRGHMRRHLFWRALRTPHRFCVYWIFRGFRKAGKHVRRRMNAPLPPTIKVLTD